MVLTSAGLIEVGTDILSRFFATSSPAAPLHTWARPPWPIELLEQEATMRNHTWINSSHVFHPLAHCPSARQLSQKTGGKWLCWQLLRPTGHRCTLLSIGIGSNTAFEQELHRELQCEIHAFDHTVTLPEKATGAAKKLSKRDRIKRRIFNFSAFTPHTQGLGVHLNLAQMAYPCHAGPCCYVLKVYAEG